MISLAEPLRLIAQNIATFDGWLAQKPSGAFTVMAGKYYAPTVTLTDDHVLGYTVQHFQADENGTSATTRWGAAGNRSAITWRVRLRSPAEWAKRPSASWAGPGRSGSASSTATSWSVPSVSRITECDAPPATAAAPVTPDICTGEVRVLLLLPSPSWPFVFRPQL